MEYRAIRSIGFLGTLNSKMAVYVLTGECRHYLENDEMFDSSPCFAVFAATSFASRSCINWVLLPSAVLIEFSLKRKVKRLYTVSNILVINKVGKSTIVSCSLYIKTIAL